MEPEELEIGEMYVTTRPVEACMYDEERVCEFDNMVNLQTGTRLAYLGLVQKDEEDYKFLSSNGNIYVLHADDLASIKEA